MVKKTKTKKTNKPEGITCPSCLQKGEKRLMTKAGEEIDTVKNERKIKLECPKCCTWIYKPEEPEDIEKKKAKLKAELKALEE